MATKQEVMEMLATASESDRREFMNTLQTSRIDRIAANIFAPLNLRATAPNIVALKEAMNSSAGRQSAVPIFREIETAITEWAKSETSSPQTGDVSWLFEKLLVMFLAVRQ